MNVAEEVMRLREMDLAGLIDRYREAFGKEPASRSRELLWKELAWKLQADRAAESAARPGAPARPEIKFTIAKSAKTDVSRRRRPDEPPVGTVIVRKWRGREVRLQVVDDGYEVDGIVYKTLSAAAEGLTGTHWNGRLFWGLVNRRKRMP